MNVVIYARFSSHSQREQSIEGQLQVCHDFARANGHVVVNEYIDRAKTGTTDNRAAFQKMIADSDKQTFEAVLVYQLERFARNRYDSAIHKAKLKKNGVRVVSALENISQDASGILVEGVLESMAEYYSVELSQKIRRGQEINAQKCLSNGSNAGLGFKVDEERRYQIDPAGAAIVQEIFERYAAGETVTAIINSLNERKIKTGHGKAFNKNSLGRILRNRRYIGTYIYGKHEVPNGMPRIIENELFERVQRSLDKNKKATARTRGIGEYLLTTKIFCGYCKEMMVGYGGTGRSKTYYYYACKGKKKNTCHKKIEDKQKLEDRIVQECRNLLTDKEIDRISTEVAAACEVDYDSSALKLLNRDLKAADTAIENLWKALEQGQEVEGIQERIAKRNAEKKELEAQIAIERNKEIFYTETQVKAFLLWLRVGDLNDETKRRGIINIFLSAIYLWDDKVTLVLNGGNVPIVIEDIPLDEIAEDNEEFVGSRMVAAVPPNGCKMNTLYLKNGFVVTIWF